MYSARSNDAVMINGPLNINVNKLNRFGEWYAVQDQVWRMARQNMTRCSGAIDNLNVIQDRYFFLVWKDMICREPASSEQQTNPISDDPTKSFSTNKTIQSGSQDTWLHKWTTNLARIGKASASVTLLRFASFAYRHQLKKARCCGCKVDEHRYRTKDDQLRAGEVQKYERNISKRNMKSEALQSMVGPKFQNCAWKEKKVHPAQRQNGSDQKAKNYGGGSIMSSKGAFFNHAS